MLLDLRLEYFDHTQSYPAPTVWCGTHQLGGMGSPHMHSVQIRSDQFNLYNASSRTCALSATMRQRSSSPTSIITTHPIGYAILSSDMCRSICPRYLAVLGHGPTRYKQAGTREPRFSYLKCPCSCLWQEAVEARADPSPKCTYAHWQGVFQQQGIVWKE